MGAYIRGLRIALLCACSAAIVTAEPPQFQGRDATGQHDALITQNLSVIPEIMDGPGTTTRLIITNLDERQINVDVVFYSGDGVRLPLPVTGVGKFSSIFGSIPTHASVIVETDGSSGSLTDAWAVVATTNRLANDPNAQLTTDKIGVTAIIRHDNGDGVVTAASQVLSPINEPNWAMPFDQRAGQNTLVSILNPSGSAPAGVTLLVQDPGGNVLRQDQFNIDPLHKQTFTLADAYPESAGMAGRIAVSTSNPLLAATAFQTDGNGNLISLFPLSTALSTPPAGSGPPDILRHAADNRNAFLDRTYLLIPEIMDGPDTTTQFLITNLDDHPINYAVAFGGNDGKGINLPIAGAGLQPGALGTIPVGGSTIVETDGSSSNKTDGYALFVTADRPATDPAAQAVLDKIGVVALLRHRNADGVTSAASMFLSPVNEPDFYVPFDQRDGSNTMLSILNPNNGPASLSIFLYDSRNNPIGLRQLTISSLNRLNLSLRDAFPATAKNVGTVTVSFGGLLLSAVGMQLDGNGNMSTLYPLSTALGTAPPPGGGGKK